MNDDQVLLEVLLDPDRLSELLGRPVRAHRLRHKPNLSTVAAISDHHGRPCGWLRLVHPVHESRIRAAQRRCVRIGVPVRVIDVAGTGLRAVTGPVLGDPGLVGGLAALPEASGTGPAAAREVLRHNPMRRLLLHDRSGTGYRITAENQLPVIHLHERLLAQGVPLAPAPRAVGKYLGVSRWWGSTDLLALTGARARAAAEAAGAALARLHGTQQRTERLGLRPVLEPLHKVYRGLADAGWPYGPQAAALARQLSWQLVALPASRLVRSHGDFSADQVAVDDTAQVRLLDLDRSRLAPAGADLGSFAATTPQLLPELRSGYLAAGGDWPETAAAVRLWTAHAMMSRLAEPFRSADPDWQQSVTARLGAVQELIDDEGPPG